MKKILTIALLGALAAAPVMEAAEAFQWAPRAKGAPAEWHQAMRPGQRVNNAAKAPVTKPDNSLPESDYYSYLDMPDGSTWFATAELVTEIVSQNEYHTDYNIKGIKATVYNDKYEPVGYIEDTITLPEGYEKCSNVQFGAAVSKKFFNFDDAYEVMLMYNLKPTGEYGADAYTNVYSLRGATTPAEKVQTMKGYYTVAVNNATDSWSEDFFMEFFTGEQQTDTQLFYSFDIYKKASYSSPRATVMQSFTVDMVYVMSDGENETMPVVLNSNGRDVYVAVAQYEKTFFENPFDHTNDKLSADNAYVIDLWTCTGYASELTKKSTTRIPCETPASGFSMRSYCLGQFQGYEDISFAFGGDDPVFIISVVDSDYQENTSSAFAIYDISGNCIKTFGAGNEGFLHLSSVNGMPEQYCFILPDQDSGELTYTFVDFPSLETKASIPVVYSDSETTMTLSMTLDRTAGGGSCRYVFADAQGDLDQDGNTLHDVAWFNADGSMLRIDRINGGKDVNLLKPYIAGHALTPWLFNTDADQEYLFFVQRQDYPGAPTAHTELCVGNAKGEMLMQCVFDLTDASITASLVNLESNPALWYSHRDFESGEFINNFISLPLNKLEGAGTAADPYLIATPGDMGLVKYNLNASYRLSADLDYEGAYFVPVTGNFTGNLDGAGHTIRNFALDSKPMFGSIISNNANNKVSIKDLTLDGVKAGSTEAILAGATTNTVISGVVVKHLDVNSESGSEFGTLVAAANVGTEITECAVVRSSISRPNSTEVGGLVSTLGNGTSVTASYFAGTIKAASEVGGIAAYSRSTTAEIRDCHVDADITAKNLIGGIIATSGRGLIERCVVEGTLTATEAYGVWSNKENGNKPMISVGGIAGHLSTAQATYDGEGNLVAPSESPVIKGCVVGLSAITIPTDDPSLLETAHRIVGRSSVNDDPEITGETYDPATYDWVYTWGDPAPAEAGITDTYAIDALPAIHAGVEALPTSTEGKDMAISEADRTFFEGLAYGFFGYAASAPWVDNAPALPRLHYEATVSSSMAFNPAEITLNEGESAHVELLLEGISVEDLTISSSDEAACAVNPESANEDGSVVNVLVEVTKTGVYTVTATNGTLTALLTVTSLSGIEDVTVATAMTYDGHTVNAPGCAIELYNMTGVRVSAATEALTTEALPAGVYVAVATAADGSRSTLKIAVR